jgi:hypothetical protein
MIRSITGAEEPDLFCALSYIVNDELADDLASGRRRPAWMWVALRGGHLVARAAWWGSDDDAAPSCRLVGVHPAAQSRSVGGDQAAPDTVLADVPVLQG